MDEPQEVTYLPLDENQGATTGQTRMYSQYGEVDLPGGNAAIRQKNHQVDSSAGKQDDSAQNVTEHTGFPNPATDTTLSCLNISSYLIKHPASTFFMRVDGHAWERYGIFHQDIAIIDRSLSPNATDLVVWWNESNFTIKRFSNVPVDSPVWGVITFIIHGYCL